MLKSSVIGCRRFVPLLGGVVLAGSLTGCVSQEEYDKLWETNRSLQSRNQQLMQDMESVRGQYDSIAGSGTNAQRTIAALQSENGELRSQLGRANQAMMGLEDRLASLEIGQLDPTTDLALSQLAARYPGMIEYDSERGMLRFLSDLTFRSGSDEVQSGAKDSLSQLASILNSPAAAEYDVKIVGHTDAERISSRTAKRHPTNMHLSAHRAIAVRKELGDQTVSWDRMYAAGWGPFRPSVLNTESGNTPENRRVEIFLVPSTRDMYVAAPAIIESTTPTRVDADDQMAPARVFEPTK